MATAGDRYGQRTGNIWSYANRGDITGLKAALIRGVDVNIPNTVGWTACHAAAAGGQTKALRYLVKAGADFSLADNGGNLPVHHAAKNGHVHSLRVLKEVGADITKVRLSQAKGKAVRDLLVEAYKKYDNGNKEEFLVEDERVVGYARKQAKSTAFWGPRRTPVSGKIKKKIIKEKRVQRKEKHSVERESVIPVDDVMDDNKVSEDKVTALDTGNASKEPSYVEIVKKIKRSRAKRQKGRQRQMQKQKKSLPRQDEEFYVRESIGGDNQRSLSSDEENEEENVRVNSVGSNFAALMLLDEDSNEE